MVRPTWANEFDTRALNDASPSQQQYLGPISTSFSPLPSVRFGSSDSASVCMGGRNNQSRTSFCSALRHSPPAAQIEREGKKKQRKLNMQSHKLPYSNSRFWLTCQLHIVAQLRGDWQLGVELGGALDGTTIHSFTAVELNHSHDGCSRRKINQLLNRRNLHQRHQSQLSPTQDDRRHMSM